MKLQYLPFLALLLLGCPDVLGQVIPENTTSQNPTTNQTYSLEFRWADIPTTMTAVATTLFVILMYMQLRNQRRAHELTMRPIITLDSDDKNPAIQLKKDKPSIQLRLANLGSITTGKARIMLLPLDNHASFVQRERALKTYIKSIKSDKLASTDSCMVLNHIRERMKSSRRLGSFIQYLVLGNDLEVLKPAKSEFDDTLNMMGSKKAEFNEAGKARAISMAKLHPKDWNMFYLAGAKRGDILDQTGPIDWENFDSDGSITREDIMKILLDDAKKIYETASDRKRILDAMSAEDRRQFDDAILLRQNIWNSLSSEITQKFAVTSMNLRKAYKSIKDVGVRKFNMLAPQHPIYLDIDLEKSDISKIDAGDYLYFGVLVQYARPDNPKYQYAYYLQGFFYDQIPHIDYTLDFLDV